MMIQEFMIKNIDEFGGLDHALSELNKLRMLITREEQRQINNIRLYYKMIYIIEVDVEADYIEYTEDIVNAINLFSAVLQKHEAPVARLFLTILTYGFDRVKTIRMIS